MNTPLADRQIKDITLRQLVRQFYGDPLRAAFTHQPKKARDWLLLFLSTCKDVANLTDTELEVLIDNVLRKSGSKASHCIDGDSNRQSKIFFLKAIQFGVWAWEED